MTESKIIVKYFNQICEDISSETNIFTDNFDEAAFKLRNTYVWPLHPLHPTQNYANANYELAILVYTPLFLIIFYAFLKLVNK
ncbi:MAG: hypothetical protein JKX76_01925 [Colwellia sp.]|nr:hypothetical protein [Colwellia sp.]